MSSQPIHVWGWPEETAEICGLFGELGGGGRATRRVGGEQGGMCEWGCWREKGCGYVVVWVGRIVGARIGSGAGGKTCDEGRGGGAYGRVE